VASGAAAELSFSKDFWESVQRLTGTETKRVIAAFTRLGDDPGHPFTQAACGRQRSERQAPHRPRL
jgi:hypothetical protein